MVTLSSVLVIACAAVGPTGSTASQSIHSYDAVMRAQYEAHIVPPAQRAEEAKRVYDAYLNSIGEKTKSQTENSSGSAGETSH